MSSYSFSHQFYQRWTCAPESIRAAIIQELTDISTLLHTDTQFENFVFSATDLDAHLDDLYENHNAEQAIAKAIADKQTQLRAAAEQERLEEAEQKKKAEEKAQLKEKEAQIRQEVQDAEALEKQNQEKNQHLVVNEKNTNDKVTNTDLTEKMVDKEAELHNDHASLSTKEQNDTQQTSVAADSSIKAVIDKAVSDTEIHLSLKNTKLGTTHSELIRELEMHVDDYLSEQMMQMSENLKSWLRAEVTQHLTEQHKPATDDNLKKN